MNIIVGYDVVGGQKFARLSGPCKGCGAVNYGISTSGPDYCGACACGTPPEVSKLRREVKRLSLELIGERERCAKIADAEAEKHNRGDGFDSQPGYVVACRIATAIRLGDG